jgi:predicted HicB family RNase H-like nuclease
MAVRRTEHINVYLSPEEHDALRKAAQADDLPLATWARRALLKTANKDNAE